MRKLSGSTNTSLSGPISRSIHRRRKVTRVKLGVSIATSRSPVNTLLFLGTLNGITVKDQLKKEDSVVCSKKEKTILTAKKSQLEQHFYISLSQKNEQDKAMKLLAHAWCENLLPPVLADSLMFSE